jgi:hypothetical protein
VRKDKSIPAATPAFNDSAVPILGMLIGFVINFLQFG